MVQLKGVYKNGHITLDRKLSSKQPLNVIVTFVDEEENILLNKNRVTDFSFANCRALLNNVTTSFSDAVIEERRAEL